MKIQFIGMQGSGKSTQAKLLAKSLNIPFYGLSDLLREYLKNNDEFVSKHYSIESINNGYLAPDVVINYLVDQISDDDYVMEGYLRTPGQAESFCENAGYNDFIFDLYIPEELAIDRMMKRGRKDDNPDAIKRRLRLYEKNSKEINKNIKKHINNNYHVMRLDSSAEAKKINNYIVEVVIPAFVELE
jgi:adenylate kinase